MLRFDYFFRQSFSDKKAAMSTSPSLQLHQSYRDDGFVFPLDIMSEDDAARHNALLTDFEANQGPMHYRVKPYLIFRSAYEIATHPRLLDAIESVLGPDILLWDCSYVIKEPQSEGFVSWHQDLTYWGLKMQSDDDLVSAWVALTPATTSNGCMQFVRGSHAGQRHIHEDTYDEINILHRGQSIQHEFDDSLISHIELAPGQASLHHGWAVHSSSPNNSQTRRVAISLNYVKPSVQQIVGETESATLVRGRDDFGNFSPEPECRSDLSPENVAFQLTSERRKREVYDTA